jgi:tetrahydromethanopterin S-methyltransferase subunit H
VNERLAAETRAAYDAAAAACAENLPDTSFEAGIDMAMIDHFVTQLPAASSVLAAACFSIDAALNRVPRKSAKHGQGFVLARS